MQNTLNKSKQLSWHLIIRPQRGWFEIPIRELWRARELIGLFVWRDFVATYKQTVLGPLWYMIQPILTSVLYLVVFGNFIRVSTDGLPPFLFYLSGTVIWNYFSSNFTKISTTFTANITLFGKVYFPRLAVPVSVVLSNLITFAIQFGILAVSTLAFWLAGARIQTDTNIVALPLCLALAGGWGLGLGIIVAAITTRYRDLQHLVTFGNQLLFFATPVLYPVSAIPEHLRWLIWMNPLAPVVEGFRLSILGVGTTQWAQLLLNIPLMLLTVLVGMLLFNRAENTVVDTI